MSEGFSTTIRNHFDELTRITPEVNQYLETAGASQDTVFMVNFVLEEMLTNIIKYGYDDTESHEIRIALTRKDACFLVTITDDGHQFNPLEQAPPDFDKPINERERGGLGIFLLKDMTKAIDYERIDGMNVLKISVTS